MLCPIGALRKKTAFNQEEAQLLALVSHRHVVKMFAACTDGPNCFIVTEFLAGGSLHEVVFDFDIALGRLARGFSLSGSRPEACSSLRPCSSNSCCC